MHESVWSDPAKGLPPPHLVDEKVPQVGPCRHQLQQVGVRQVHVPPEIEVYATEVPEGHNGPQIIRCEYKRIRSNKGNRVVSLSQPQPCN